MSFASRRCWCSHSVMTPRHCCRKTCGKVRLGRERACRGTHRARPGQRVDSWKETGQQLLGCSAANLHLSARWAAAPHQGRLSRGGPSWNCLTQDTCAATDRASIEPITSMATDRAHHAGRAGQGRAGQGSGRHPPLNTRHPATLQHHLAAGNEIRLPPCPGSSAPPAQPPAHTPA